MRKRWKDVAAVLLVIIVALALWLPGLDWGLPSRAADPWLFGGRPAWSGAEILSRLGQASDGASSPVGDGQETRGADVDSTPIADRSKPVLLNGDDAKRAAIVQRFRLMSGQPDEFIQFKALAEMSQRQGLSKLDPRLYQYGGLWIYPVGALVRCGMALGWIETPPAGISAREFYLDRPDAFGRFYVVGRAYSLAWGVVAAVAVFLLARTRLRDGDRDATSSLLGLLTALAFVASPVVRTATHEAKPHLAGAALCLLAVLAAQRYATTGWRRWLVMAGALCGASMAMVVSMLLSLAILPVAVIARKRLSSFAGVAAKKNAVLPALLLAGLAAAAVYAMTNPFVVINAVVAPHLLRSNLGNSTGMYGVRGPLAMLPDAWRIAGHAMTNLGWLFAIALALTAVTLLLWRSTVPAADAVPLATWRHRRVMFSVLWGPATLVAIQFVLLAAGKPAEYARFGLVFFAATCVAGAAALRSMIDSPVRFAAVFVPLLGALALIPASLHPRGYDGWKWPVKDHTALQLETMRKLAEVDGRWRLGVAYEPAPWSTPPVNLFDQDILLVRATPEMLNEVDCFVWPTNLESQIFDAETDRESLDWRENRFGHRAESREGDADRWRGGW